VTSIFQLHRRCATRNIALDASLRIQHQVVGAGLVGKRFDSIGDHAAQPAEAIFAAYRDALQPAQIMDRYARKKCSSFDVWSVQLLWGERAAVRNKRWRGSGAGCGKDSASAVAGLRSFGSLPSYLSPLAMCIFSAALESIAQG
jgi:hypothetical protein